MHLVRLLAHTSQHLWIRLYELGLFGLLLVAVWVAGMSVAPLFDEDDGTAQPPPGYCGNSQSSTVVMHR